MRILVTGATGFVGSHCLEALAKTEGVEIIVGCRDARRVAPEFEGEIRVGDLRNKADVDRMLQDVDVVIHAAAWSSLKGNRVRSGELFLRPSLRLIHAAKKQGIRRFVFISSVSVAAPENATDARHPGRKRKYWPHEANVVRIEEELKKEATSEFCAVVLRLGIFAGRRYGLGLLPILTPRLKTHLVPWVVGGKTGMPIIDGRDIGRAAALAASVDGLTGYEAFNIVGPEIPSVREVLTHLHDQYGLPLPHYSVPFPVAFAFAWLMEMLDPLVPWEPLVTRSIIHLLQETGVNNGRATERLGYIPKHHWKDAVDAQMAEMAVRQTKPMKMAREISDGRGCRGGIWPHACKQPIGKTGHSIWRG